MQLRCINLGIRMLEANKMAHSSDVAVPLMLGKINEQPLNVTSCVFICFYQLNRPSPIHLCIC